MWPKIEKTCKTVSELSGDNESGRFQKHGGGGGRCEFDSYTSCVHTLL